LPASPVPESAQAVRHRESAASGDARGRERARYRAFEERRIRCAQHPGERPAWKKTPSLPARGGR